jgi:hypothetical protein
LRHRDFVPPRYQPRPKGLVFCPRPPLSFSLLPAVLYLVKSMTRWTYRPYPLPASIYEFHNHPLVYTKKKSYPLKNISRRCISTTQKNWIASAYCNRFGPPPGLPLDNSRPSQGPGRGDIGRPADRWCIRYTRPQGTPAVRWCSRIARPYHRLWFRGFTSSRNLAGFGLSRLADNADNTLDATISATDTLRMCCYQKLS